MEERGEKREDGSMKIEDVAEGLKSEN